jgi:hypothetical protein
MASSSVSGAIRQIAQPIRLRYPILSNSAFLVVWSGQTLSVMGSQVSGLALPLLVLALTGSPAQAGIASAVRLVPYAALSLPAGALIDRWDRRLTMVAADVVRGLALAAVPVAYLAGQLSLWLLYGAVLIEGIAFVFFTIAQIASLTRLVSSEELAPANAMMETSGSVATLVGPGLGGWIIGLARSAAAGGVLGLGVDAITYLVSACSLLLVRTSLKAEQAGRSVRSLPAQIVEGLGFLFRHPQLRVLALLGLDLGLLVIPTDLAAIVLARQGLRLGPATIGLIFSAGGLGALLGSAAGPWFRRRWRLGRVTCGTLAVQAAASTAMAVTGSAWVLAAGMLAQTMMLPIYNISQASYRLQLIPDELQGRVNSVYRLLPLGSQPLGLAAAGLLMGVAGPRLVLGLIAGGFAAAAVLVRLSSLRDV